MTAHHVLLVEDSEFLAGQVSETLTIHDVQADTVETAAAAREAIADSDVDCVLVNHDLPDETGIEFARSVASDLPVILFTSTTLEEIAAEAIEAGVTEFVHKDDLATGSMTVLANRIDVAIQARS